MSIYNSLTKIKLLIVGPAMGGKTYLSHYLTNNMNISHNCYIPTIVVDISYSTINIHDTPKKLLIYDSAGSLHFRTSPINLYKDADIICIVVDLQNHSETSIQSYYEEAILFSLPKPIIMIIRDDTHNTQKVAQLIEQMPDITIIHIDKNYSSFNTIPPLLSQIYIISISSNYLKNLPNPLFIAYRYTIDLLAKIT